jgi:hypothetical protein
MELEVLRGMAGVLRAFHPGLVVELHRGVDRDELLDVAEGLGYSRCAVPVEPAKGEVDAQYLDDRSYAFVSMSLKNRREAGASP